MDVYGVVRRRGVCWSWIVWKRVLVYDHECRGNSEDEVETYTRMRLAEMRAVPESSRLLLGVDYKQRHTTTDMRTAARKGKSDTARSS